MKIFTGTMQHNTKEYDYLIRLLLVGDPGSGKTWFIKRAAEELIPDVTISQPLDTDFKIKTITEPETNKVIKLQIWKHKEERFITIATNPYRGAHGVIVTVDVTSRDSFNNMRHYFQYVDRYACEKVKVLVIATKSDDSTQRKVFTEEILEVIETQKQEEYWTDRDLQFIETSAKNDYNINHALQTISRSILRRVMDLERDEPSTIKLTLPNNNNNNNNTKEKPRCIVM